ncbi:MAG: 16S rRNA (guanine(527)-N(7))-methyltransferase RsmG [Armatimonadota bacterium]
MSDEPALLPGTEQWERFAEQARQLRTDLQPEQVEGLRIYLELLVEWNRRFNLTAIRDPEEILTKHFLDSLSCAAVVDFSQRRSLVDVGTGAGFPGMVLKIVFPHLQVTLLDAVEKRLAFLDRVAEALSLRDVRTVHSRAEDATGTWRAPQRRSETPPGAREVPTGALRERFDVATARAVARLNVLSEWLLPFVRVGGVALAMKGPEVAEETAEAGRAIQLLGGGAAAATELTLPGSDLRRSLVAIPKVRPTPRTYPRRAGSARKSPL